MRRFMVGRIEQVEEKSCESEREYQPRSDWLHRNLPRVDSYKSRVEVDPYLDPSLLNQIDKEHHGEIQEGFQRMLKVVRDKGLPPVTWNRLKKILYEHIDVFRVGLSHGPSAQIPTLKIELSKDSSPIRVKLRNYTRDQRLLLYGMTTRLFKASMAYSNPSDKRASAPLIVPKPGTSKFRFTVDLRSVNRLNILHQFPMPRFEQELTKLSASKFFSNFDLSMG